jgi:arabinogalactan endo-1,4-beta-galactosidase
MRAVGALRCIRRIVLCNLGTARNCSGPGAIWVFFAAAALCISTTTALGDTGPFYMGADISLETFIQQQLAAENNHFSDNGVAAPMDQIMYDHGANMFRLRIFVNPQTTYSNTNVGAIQTTAYDIALAQQIKADAPGAKILLDFHYSDTWADPSHQTKPAAWSSDATQAQLDADVQSYTANTLTSFYNAGVMPDMVQVGNETTNGMLWQTGTIGQNGATGVGGRLLYSGSQQNLSWQNFGGLLNSAIAGVRSVQTANNLPRIPVALSIDGGDRNGTPQYFYGNIQNSALGNVTDFDVEGVDYYPSSGNASDSFAYLQSNLTTLANTNYTADPADPKKIMLLETNYPYTTHSGIGISTWPSTPAGQEAEWVAVRNLMMTLPHNDGEGLLYWYPEAVQVPGYNIYNGGTTALFDATSAHNAEPVITDNEFAPIKGDFNGDGHFNAADIQAMLSALANLSAYQSARGLTNPDMTFLGDFNGDGVVNNADLQGMINSLLSGGGSTDPVPEPAAGWLLAMGVMALLLGRSRRRKA